MSPANAPPASIQIATGNRAVQRLITAVGIQPKLTIGTPDDVYEKEADAVAEKVIAAQTASAATGAASDDDGDRQRRLARKAADRNLVRQLWVRRTPIRTLQQTLGNHALARLLEQTFPPPAGPELHRKCACGGDSEEECAECRKNRLALQHDATGEGAGLGAPEIVEDVLCTPGEPLADSARKVLEPGFGHDFSQVRVHHDSKAAESASAVNALAYTVGNHIVFGTGQYMPGTKDGNRLLAHELTHTIQQTGGVVLDSNVARLPQAEGNQVQRDSDTPDQADQPAAAAPSDQIAGSVPGSTDQTTDDSGPVSLEPITVEAESQGPTVEGCEGLSLHGKTTPTYGRSSKVENQVANKGQGCNCAKGVQCIHLTGTLITKYSVTVAISMPSVPRGLTACERAKVKDFLDNVLLPHELDHKAKFETYNGQTKNPLDITGCGRDELKGKIGAIQDAENTPRQAAAQALSDSIDPFVRTIDCSDCQKRSAAPGAGQEAGAETEIAAKRMSFAGDAALQRMGWMGSAIVARVETPDQAVDGGAADEGTADGGVVTNDGADSAVSDGADSAVSDGSAAQGLIVDDDVSELSAGQMKKSDFLAQLRGPVSGAAQDALQGSAWEATGSVAIEPWFEYYASQSAQQLEQSIRSNVSGAAGVTEAGSYVPLVSAQVATAVKEWAISGTLPAGVPPGLPGVGTLGSAVSSLAQGAESTISNIGGMLFKRREGAAQVSDHPAAVRAQLGAGEALDGSLLGRMSSALGYDFSGVRVHRDTKAAQLAGELGARAFAIGRDIAFGVGEYQPGTPIGDALIAHELAHVMQQGGAAVQDRMQKGEAEIGSLEEEANVSAVQAVVSLWGGAKAGLANLGRNVIPSLKSGLKLQRCTPSGPVTGGHVPPSAFEFQRITEEPIHVQGCCINIRIMTSTPGVILNCGLMITYPEVTFRGRNPGVGAAQSAASAGADACFHSLYRTRNFSCVNFASCIQAAMVAEGIIGARVQNGCNIAVTPTDWPPVH